MTRRSRGVAAESGAVPARGGAARSPVAPLPSLVAAAPADLPDVEALLRAVDLTTEGVAACVTGGSAVICRDRDGCLLGVAAVEPYGEAVLLRSVAVDAAARGRGLGAALVARALADARVAGAREAWLLTETAEPFFALLGWERAERAAAPPGVASSVEMTSACPASAVAMRRAL